MSNFLVIAPLDGFSHEGIALFRHGLHLAKKVGFQPSAQTLDNQWAAAALFPRANGSGKTLVTEADSNSWLLSIGTWFHSHDCACEDEAQLLKRYLEVGPTRLGRELEGFFCLVIGDVRSQEVVVITDIVGSCHC
ncbi:MAG: hypothetical protein ACE5HM_09230, partial [Acidiferrobacterales bacterium]